MNKTLDDESLFRIVFNVNEKFYDKVYQDKWLKKIFTVVDQKIIISQQTDFIVQSLGGPKRYGGRMPNDAHPHIFVNEKMWDLREKYLKEAMCELNCPKDIMESWIKIDNAFKKSIIKNDLSECKKRYASDEIIFFID